MKLLCPRCSRWYSDDDAQGCPVCPDMSNEQIDTEARNCEERIDAGRIGVMMADFIAGERKDYVRDWMRGTSYPN